MIEITKDLALSFVKWLSPQQNITQLTQSQPTQTISPSTNNTASAQLNAKLFQWVRNLSSQQSEPAWPGADVFFELARLFETLNFPHLSRSSLEIIVEKFEDQDNSAIQACISLAELLERDNDKVGAVRAYQKMIDLDLDKHIAYNRIGLIFMDIQQFEQALINFELSIRTKPDYLQAHINRGVAYQNKGFFKDAVKTFEHIILIDPTQINAHYNLGIAHFSDQNFERSIRSLQTALQLNPALIDAHYNLGVVYSQIKEHILALECYKRAIHLNHQYLLAHYNSGVSYFELLEYKKALESYKKAIALDPDHIRSHWNVAHCHLILGEFREGFSEYEWRWRHNELQNQQTQRKFSKPLWLGEQDINGLSILLHAEQGFGDTLQFIRYVQRVASLGAHLIIEVQPALKSLVNSSISANLKHLIPNQDWTVLARGEVLPDFDLHCPLMTLPLALGLTTAFELAEPCPPYLSVDPQLGASWAQRLNTLISEKELDETLNVSSKIKPKISQNTRRLRFGLVWSSGYRQDQKETWEINKERNLDLKALEPLLQLPVHWVSLQIGKIPNQELADLNQEGGLGIELLDMSPYINDFADTAAIAQNLDAIVTVDTSTAHLCGALGLKTFVLLKANACWRWFLNTSSSTWYPSAVLIRQRKKGDWSDALNQATIEIKKILSH